ncbi:MAG: hypothetical protein QF415_05050 [Candidatus Undinarchaeales archaeon]|jgi:hypothetical protein|nr:hypothetical protein [Candidatus Undinarchaeales archaeon]MDP7494533.1 hypothetical protein [Candidatus Undinarchaeales archaeon]
MDVTIRKVDERAYRLFKARAAERGLNLGEALSIALQEWSKHELPQGPRTELLAHLPVFDWGTRSESLSEDIDRILYGGE